jgi:hypothetical protein
MNSQENNINRQPVTPKDGPYVFVSYSSQYFTQIEPVIEAVRKKGYRVSFDRDRDLSPILREETYSAIDECELLLAFLPPNDPGPNNVRAEIRYALSRQLKVITVNLSPLGGPSILAPDLEQVLGSAQKIDGRSDPSTLAKKIADALANLRMPKIGDLSDVTIAFIKRRCPLINRLPNYAPKAIWPLIALFLVGLIILAVTSKPAPTAFKPGEAYLQATPPAAVIVQTPPAADASINTQTTPALAAENANQASPAEAAEEAAQTTPAEAAEEAVQTTPAEAAREAAQTTPAEAAEEAAQTAPTEASGEAAQTAPADAPEEAAQALASGSLVLTTEKTVLAPGEPFKVNVSEVSPSMLLEGAVVGIYRQGTGGEDFLIVISLDHTEETLVFDAPRNPGQYELRAYSSHRTKDQTTLQRTLPITVENPTQQDSENSQ